MSNEWTLSVVEENLLLVVHGKERREGEVDRNGLLDPPRLLSTPDKR